MIKLLMQYEVKSRMIFSMVIPLLPPARDEQENKSRATRNLQFAHP